MSLVPKSKLNIEKCCNVPLTNYTTAVNDFDHYIIIHTLKEMNIKTESTR